MAWFNELFPKAFDWALSHPWAVPTTRHGFLMGLLSHLAVGVPTRRAFVVALARGLGSGMEPPTREEFAAELTR
jgi:dynein heavy chain 2